jgi:Glycosyl transferase family 90
MNSKKKWQRVCLSVLLNWFIFFQFLNVGTVYGLPEPASFLSKLQEVPPSWMNKQIRKDFVRFRKGIDTEMIDSICGTLSPYTMLLVRFKVINNEVHYDASQDWSGRSHTVRNALQYLIDTVGLPDLDFVMSMHDGLDLSDDLQTTVRGPILCFAKSERTSNGILVPDIEALGDYRSRFSFESLQVYPWESKEKKAFWRGSTTGGFYTRDNWHLMPRSCLTLLSLQRPDLLDAKFSGIVQYAADVPAILHAHQLVGDYRSVQDHTKYRYLVDVDGNSCTYSRCYWILLSNSLLLKQVSQNIQWYYQGLVPYQHYVPLASDVSDIFEKIEWAQSHDEEAKWIAEQASAFASQSLSVENIYVYFYKVLLKYARFQR